MKVHVNAHPHYQNSIGYMPQLSRLQNLRSLFFSTHPDAAAFIVVAGPDSAMDEPSMLILKYLFAPSTGPAVLQPEASSSIAALDDVFLVVFRDSAVVYTGSTSSQGCDCIIRTALSWPGTEIVQLPDKINPQDAKAEDFKARSFVEATYGLAGGLIGLLFDSNKHAEAAPKRLSKAQSLVETWPLVQATALESHGMRSRGFFSATRTIVPCGDSLLRAVLDVDGTTMMDLVGKAVPRLTSHFYRSLKLLQSPFWSSCGHSLGHDASKWQMRQASPAAAQLSEAKVAEDLLMLREFAALQQEGVLRLPSAQALLEVPPDRAGCWMGMRTALLPATLWAAAAASGGKGGDGPGSDDAAASKGIDRAPSIGQAGPAGTLATHAVVRGHDPSSGLQLARTVILRAGGQERGDSGSNAAVSAALSALQKGHTLAQKAMASCMARCARPASGAAGAGGVLDAGPRLVRLAAAALAALTRAWGFPAIAETLGREAIQTAKSTLQVAIDVTNAAGQLECSVRATPAGCYGSADAGKAG